jgi:hypothetical protein
MTSAAVGEPTGEELAGSKLAAGAVEFLAVGGATLLLFPIAWLVRTSFGLSAAELAIGFVMFHAAHFINDPHFCVTYLLFYKDFRARLTTVAWNGAQRARYVIAGLVVPAALVAWAALGLATRSAQTLGWLIQLMFLLVGWHYAKQGFGVLSVLSARRGARFSARERGVILGHCFSAWAFSWANPVRAAGQFEEKGIVYWGPAHPFWFEIATGAALAVSSVALGVVLVQKWRREGPLPLTPLTGFLVTIWFWTIYTGFDPLVRYVIPALHSIQYLYFVWLMKSSEARAHEGPPSFGPPVATRLSVLALSALALGWLMLRGGPELLDVSLSQVGGGALGDTPFFAVCFAGVNIHHYFMDYVIWRRENPDSHYLQH